MKKEEILKKDNGKALFLHIVISRLERRLTKLVNEINNKRDELQEICIHNETIKKEDYIEGGYLDREEYITTIVCKVCGKVLDKQVETGGFC